MSNIKGVTKNYVEILKELEQERDGIIQSVELRKTKTHRKKMKPVIRDLNKRIEHIKKYRVDKAMKDKEPKRTNLKIKKIKKKEKEFKRSIREGNSDSFFKGIDKTISKL